MPQDIEEAVKGKSTIKLLLCVALAIGEVSRSDGEVENAIVSICLYRIYPFLPPPAVSRNMTENCVRYIGKRIYTNNPC